MIRLALLSAVWLALIVAADAEPAVQAPGPGGVNNGPPGIDRFADVIGAGPGSKCKAGGVIGLPYLDGVQHSAMPEVTRG